MRVVEGVEAPALTLSFTLHSITAAAAAYSLTPEVSLPLAAGEKVDGNGGAGRAGQVQAGIMYVKEKE